MTDVHDSSPGETSKNEELLQSLFRAAVMTSRESIKPRFQKGPLPLSAAQQQMLFLSSLQPKSPAYNTFRAYHITGQIDIKILEVSLQEIVRRHDALRTTFTVVDGTPLQVTGPDPLLEFSFKDYSNPDESTVQVSMDNGFVDYSSNNLKILKLLTSEAQRTFDLLHGPNLRVMLLRLAKETYCLLLAMPHIVCDGWSIENIFKELASHYETFLSGSQNALPALPIQYSDYALWQTEWLQCKTVTMHIEYWKQQLQDSTTCAYLPLDHPRPSEQGFQGACETVALSKPLTDSLKNLGYREGATLFMTILSAFQTLLHRYSGQTDIVVGSPVACRNHVETHGLIGCFVNSLPFRTDLTGNPTFRELLRRVCQVCLDAYAHQDLPFKVLVEKFHAQRDPATSPFFQTVFVLQNSPGQGRNFAGLTFQEICIDNETTKYDLTLILEEFENGLHGRVEYNTDLFDHTTITRMIDHFLTLLEGIVVDPDQRVSALPLLTQAEQHQLLVEWNTEADYPKETCIHELFEAQAERTPDVVAVVYADQRLTYKELNDRANRLAHYLQKLGVGPEVLVGICLERSLEMVVGLLGILKAGGAYVPLDPEYPRERLLFMIEDSRVPVLLTQARFRKLIHRGSADVVCLDTDWPVITLAEGSSAISRSKEENLAYVIYTSGSTGKPKGAMNTHAGVCNRLLWMQEAFELTSEDRVLQKTPYSFDVSVWEFFWPLIVGAQLIMAKPGGHRDNSYLASLMQSSGITTVHFVPSMLRIFLESALYDNFPWLERVFCSGEELSPDLVENFFSCMKAELHNLYGPTEAAIDVTHWACEEEVTGSHVPIGRPVSNTKVYLLDGCLNQVPVGIHGEIYIGGVQVARGYLNRPELTMEKFIPDPFSHKPGTRLYRTGDLGRYKSDGNIEFLGRIDQQVKIRGLRIELGEIEAVLRKHPKVSESVVVVQEEDSNNKCLVSYVVSNSGGVPTVTELRRFLSKKLPGYLIPSIFVMLDGLPLTPSGKVDRRALPALHRKRPDIDERHVAPRTSIEESLTSIWIEILGIKQLGIQDNFFELGGDSLAVTRIINRVRNTLGVEISYDTFFEGPTIAELSICIDQRSSHAVEPKLPLDFSESGNRVTPLSFGQQEIWFISQMFPELPIYNEPFTIHMKEQVDPAALERALNQLIDRHEILRTAFITKDGQPLQAVKEDVSLSLNRLDLRVVDLADRVGQSLQAATAEARRPFNLTKPPLLRATLIQIDEAGYLLYLTFHHIIIDALSIYNVLVPELWSEYLSLLGQKSSPLADLPMQYAGYIRLQREWVQTSLFEKQLAYLKKQFDGTATLDLPTDHPRPPKRNFIGAHQSFSLSGELTSMLEKLGRRQGATLYMVLLSAFKVLLWRYTHQDDLVVGTVESGRSRPEFESLLGCFVNIFAIRTNLSQNPSFQKFLQQVRHVALQAYAHKDVPFSRLMEALKPSHDPVNNPFFNVCFVMEPTFPEELSGWSVSQLEVQTGTAKYDLTLELEKRPKGIIGRFEFRTDLFEQTTISKMIDHFQTLLEGIVADPDQTLNELPLLTEAERQQLLVEWNATSSDYPRDACIDELFEAQVERTPDAVAVVFANQQLTYRELNSRANQLAHYLKKHGLRPEVLVGICLERSLEMVVGLLGILKAGGAYVPLDPEYPTERLSFMARDAGIQLLLTSSGLRTLLSSLDIPVIYLDDEEILDDAHEGFTTAASTAADLAYVMYTSGSTGVPKGIEVTHRNVVRLVRNTNYVRLNSSTTLLHYAPLAFDASTFEIWGALLNGGTLVVCPPGRLTLHELGQIIEANQVNTLWLTSALFHTVVENNPEILRPVSQLLAGGDVLSAVSVKKVLSRDGITLINGYGPTENTTFTCCYPMTESSLAEGKVPIGRPIANTTVYILDKSMQPVPVGVVGELFTGGDGVARGYRNRPELTAEKFITDPFSSESGARLYRTGDLARYRSDGNIEFLGRIDHQVKIRGFLIEPGEIEAVLNLHPTISDCVVVLQEEEPGYKRLVAYVVSSSDKVLTTPELRRFVGRKLPEYMVPALFVMLEVMPLTPSGKVDRNSLPASDHETTAMEVEVAAPESPYEAALASIWSRILGVKLSNTHDNFFELGGHSLQAMQVVAWVRRDLHIELSILDIFNYPTVSSLAQQIDRKKRKRC